jgi:phage-related tail fiber protein
VGTFGGLVLTNRGKNLQAKAQTGTELKYTRIAMGDGQLGSTSVLGLNALISERKSLNITKLKKMSGGIAVVGGVFSNREIAEGFYYREIGVFALDPDIGEVLYCYANAGALAEYIPPGGSSDIIEKSIDVQTVIGNAENVTATIDESLVWETQAGAQAKIDNVINPIDITSSARYRLGYDNGVIFFEEV